MSKKINKYISFYNNRLATDDKTIFFKYIKYRVTEEDSDNYYLRVGVSDMETIPKSGAYKLYDVGEIKKASN